MVFLTSWNLFACLDWNYDKDLKGKLAFFSAESEYYPYFEVALREQVAQREQQLTKELQC